MKWETFKNEFEKQNPDCFCGRIGKEFIGTYRKNGVAITFRPDGKVYEYGGSLYSVAERLDLIPELEAIDTAAKRIVESMLVGDETVVGPNGCIDTIRLLGESWIESESFDNEFGQGMAVYRWMTEEEIARAKLWIMN